MEYILAGQQVTPVPVQEASTSSCDWIALPIRHNNFTYWKTTIRPLHGWIKPLTNTNLAQWKTCSTQLFHGWQLHEATAKMSTVFITSLFACLGFLLLSTNLTMSGQPVPSPKLTHLVAYALYHTRLASCITSASLLLPMSLHMVKRFRPEEFHIRWSLTDMHGNYLTPSRKATAFRSKVLQDNYHTAPQGTSNSARSIIHHKVLTYQHFQNMAELQDTSETPSHCRKLTKKCKNAASITRMRFGASWRCRRWLGAHMHPVLIMPAPRESMVTSWKVPASLEWCKV